MSLLEPADQVYFPPLAPALAELSIVDRMLCVIRRNAQQGQPTTLTDFREAEETCDLTVGQLTDNIGAAKRLMNREVIRYDQPPRPVDPWDMDEKYRAQRVRRAAELLAGAGTMGDGDIYAVLRNSGYSSRELGALWKDILVAAADLVRGCKFAEA